jgi:hypothetical protein
MDELNLVKGNLNILNEVIDQAQPGAKNDTISDMIRGFKKLEPRI